MKIVLFGFPGPVGGAGTECWHTLKLWRKFGIEVTSIPTSPPNIGWLEKVQALGVNVVEWPLKDLANCPHTRGQVVVSFCNSVMLDNYAKLIKQAGAKLVWVNCMTYMFANEHSLLRQHGLFDYYIFQSLYQMGQIVPQLEKWGEPRHTLIRGYLDLEEYPYRPAERGKSDPFVICRISRQDPDKWYRRYFRLLEQLLDDPGCPPIQAKCKQIDGVVRRKLAPIPDWAYCPGLSEGDATEILYSSHCMFPINHNARENWPRVGLEAMAAGVPIVTHDAWGWKEMLHDGLTGLLANEELGWLEYLRLLRDREDIRLDLAQRARSRVIELTDPDILGPRWLRVFEELGA